MPGGPGQLFLTLRARHRDHLERAEAVVSRAAHAAPPGAYSALMNGPSGGVPLYPCARQDRTRDDPGVRPVSVVRGCRRIPRTRARVQRRAGRRVAGCQ